MQAKRETTVLLSNKEEKCYLTENESDKTKNKRGLIQKPDYDDNLYMTAMKEANLCEICRRKIENSTMNTTNYIEKQHALRKQHCRIAKENSADRSSVITLLSKSKSSQSIDVLSTRSEAYKIYDLKAQCKLLQAENEALFRKIEDLTDREETLECQMIDLMDSQADLLEENNNLKQALESLIAHRTITYTADSAYNNKYTASVKIPDQSSSFGSINALVKELEKCRVECRKLSEFKLKVLTAGANVMSNIKKYFPMINFVCDELIDIIELYGDDEGNLEDNVDFPSGININPEINK